MKKETYKICKVLKHGHMWVDDIQGQQNMLDYISDNIHEKKMGILVITYMGMQDAFEDGDEQ